MASSKTPTERMFHLLWVDRFELSIVFSYALAAGVLTLAIPLASQALVNTIAQGLFLQPLLVLTGAVMIGLLLHGVLEILIRALAEQLQLRLFARLGLRLTELLPRFRYQNFLASNGPEELNKFFEVVNVQKSWNKLLLDVPSSMVELALSFLFLSLYGPSFMLSGAGLILIAGLTIVLLGYGGLTSSIKESYAKYDLAGWLEQMGRCQDSIKLAGAPTSFVERSDELVGKYLYYRKRHFQALLRQLSMFYLLQALAAAGVLGLGGWMVIQRQLSLGQLVAGELVVLNLLKACEKLVKSAETVFDLMTGLDKLGHLLEIPLDEPAPHTLNLTRGASLAFRQVSYRHTAEGREVLSNFSLEIEAGSRVSLLAESGSGMSTLARLAVGLIRPTRGQVEVEGLQAHSNLRSQLVWLTDREEIFDTTVEENITMGREFSPADLRFALELSGVNEHLPWLPDGLQTQIICGGRNLSRSQVMRILLARNIIHRPYLLVVDQNFYALGFERRIETVRKLFDRSNRWTILNLVAETEALLASDRIMLLKEGQVLDLGSPAAAIAPDDGPLAQQFPELRRALRRRLAEA